MNDLRQKYIPENALDSDEGAEEKLHEDIIDAIENNGDPQHVLNDMMKQRERDQIMVAQDRVI
jgi:hypothetical protein